MAERDWDLPSPEAALPDLDLPLPLPDIVENLVVELGECGAGARDGGG